MLPPSELGELEAFRSLLAGAPGAYLAEIGGALCTAFEPTPTAAICNRALGLGQARAAATEDLDAIDAFFAGLGLAYCVTASPEARPPELAARLDARGFHRGYPWLKFRRTAEPATVVETELRIEHLAAGAGDVFAEVFTRAAGTPEPLRERLERIPRLPGWHCFVGYADDTPAATAALFVSNPERIGWLGAAGTLPEFRRRGAQSALLAARINAGVRAGCTVLVTEAGTPREGRPSGSYRNIVRAGFEPVYVRQNYLSSAEADASGTIA